MSAGALVIARYPLRTALRQRQRQTFVRLATIAIALAMLPAAQAHAQDSGAPFLHWNEGGATFAAFGANSTIMIYTGRLAFVNDCAEGGVNDSIYAWSDVYVVR